MNINVRINGKLEQFIDYQVGDSGSYENVSEYVRDLIRHDMQDKELQALEALKNHLRPGFEASQEEFVTLSLDDVLQLDQ